MTAPLSKYVTLISSDGFEYIIRREAAYVAGTIKRMLDPKSALSRNDLFQENPQHS